MPKVKKIESSAAAAGRNDDELSSDKNDVDIFHFRNVSSYFICCPI